MRKGILLRTWAPMLLVLMVAAITAVVVGVTLTAAASPMTEAASNDKGQPAPTAATAQEPSASIVLGDPNDEHGLVQIEQGDGATKPVTVGGQSARATVGTAGSSMHMYFQIDDAIAFDSSYVACVRAEYYDEGTASFDLQYDSQDSAYASSGSVVRAGTNTWQTAAFNIVDGRFDNRENGGSDFRLAAGTAGVTVHSVTLTIIENDDGVTPPCSVGDTAPSPKWKLLHSENFQSQDKSFSTDSSPWIRNNYDQPFDTIMDDNGNWWKNDYGPTWAPDVLRSFVTYRKEVPFGQNGWLTAAVSARDWTNSGTPQNPPTISTERLNGQGNVHYTERLNGHQGNVLKINSPDSYDGALITTTQALPPEYRIEYHLKTLNFGGQRNGSIFYDGKENGYTITPGECKTQFPYAEGIGTPGWNSDPTDPNPCDWQSVTNGPFGYNAFHLLGIVDFNHPEPANLHFWHYKRKVLMDSFAQHPDRIGSGTGGRVCDPTTNTYYAYRDSTYNVVDMWFNGLPNFSPSKGGITGNSQWFSSTCTRGQPVPISPYAAAEMQPELMPNSDYVFAVERSKTGYTEEVTGDFLRGGHMTLRFYAPFTGGATPIWHYNNTPDQYDGRYDHTLVQNGVYNQEQWVHQWPAGSGYPDYPVIGDPYTDAGEGSASLTDIRLYVPKTKH